MISTSPVRAICVDGPLAGAQVTFPPGLDTTEFHDPASGPVTYRLGDDFSTFPGSLRSAHVVPPPPSSATKPTS